jgi:hypothetical protein
MHFHANYVSTSVFGDGDYYQATFQVEQDSDDPDSNYSPPLGENPVTSPMLADSIAGELVGRHGAIEASR